MEDLKQAVYLRLWQRDVLGQYDPSRGAFQTLLFRVARSVAINAFAWNTRKKRQFAVPLCDPQSSPASQLAMTEARDVIQKLEQVAGRLRDGAELLQTLQQLALDRSPREMAAHLCCSQQQLAKRRLRLRALLVKRLQVTAA